MSNDMVMRSGTTILFRETATGVYLVSVIQEERAR